MNVRDLDACSRFYREVIGMTELRRAEDHSVLGAGDTELVELHATPDAPSYPNAPGLFHMAIRLPTRTDLSTWVYDLFSHQREVQSYLQGASDHGVSEALYLHDPEGNGVEVYADRPETMWPRKPNGQIDMYTARLDIESLVSIAKPDGGGLRQLPARSDMGHVHLRVNDVKAAKEFYVDTLGLDLTLALGDSALFVSTDRYHHHIGLNSWESRGSEPRSLGALGLDSVTLRFELSDTTVPSIRRSQAFANWLESQHISATIGENDTVLVTDPAGNRIRFVVD